VIGAGAVVTVDDRIPARTVALGSPAKVRKSLSGRAAAWIEHGTSASLALAATHRREGFGDPQQHDIKSAKRKKRAPSQV
jgi:carbonic anhydrase/acetyltransferase-like protein (isoleucine patch superfamily)